jgi:APA family basic amino acid/polyamine antiporter
LLDLDYFNKTNFFFHTVGVGWSGYFVKFFHIASYGRITFSPSWTQPPLWWTEEEGTITLSGNYFNVPGFVIIMLITIVLVIG